MIPPLRRSLALALAAICPLACSSESDSAKPSLGTDAGLLDAAKDVGSPDDGGSDVAVEAAVEASTPPFEGPASLAATGLYFDIATRSLTPGVMAYDVRFPLWSDGSDKQRYLLLPAGQTVDTTDMDWWSFPIGTKAWKQFSLAGQAIETRYLEKRADGWLMIAYLWNSEGTDAYPVPKGQVDAAGTPHDVPSQKDCEQCHNGVGDTLVGVSALQLTAAAQPSFLSELISGGWLSAPPASEPDVPGDVGIQAALGYLHGNCGQCHNDKHFLASKRPMRLRLKVGAATPEDTTIYQTAINASMNHVVNGTSLGIVPGQPEQSQLWVRMSYRDEDSMPPLGTEIVDATGLAVIKAWIAGLQ